MGKNRRTKEKNEINWKEKSLYGKFSKSISKFADSVLRHWLKSGYVSITAAEDQTLRTKCIKANIDHRS